VDVRVAVLADTHILDGGRTALPGRAWRVLDLADVILHAGDVTGAAFLRTLQELAPVHAVRGNNDTQLTTLPDRCVLELEGVRVAMIHDSGARRGREARMQRRFPEAAIVVFGHSHIPWNAAGVRPQWLFNPGSATLRRRQPHRTMGALSITDGAVRTEIIVLDE
jgi:putative phosphoesterase